MRKKEQEHLIQTVYPGSIAEELEIEPGDVLLKINGQKIEDVFDYRYLMKDGRPAPAGCAGAAGGVPGPAGQWCDCGGHRA